MGLATSLIEDASDVLHVLIDVVAGRRNLPAHDADAAHEAITPGYTAVEPSADAIAAAEAVLRAKALADAKSASGGAA